MTMTDFFGIVPEATSDIKSAFFAADIESFSV
jgi:hypothetical protein